MMWFVRLYYMVNIGFVNRLRPSVESQFTLLDAICPTQLVLLDFVSHIIMGERYKLGSSLLCSL
jgi:hypothetical protein